MRFRASSEQSLIRETWGRFFRKECPLTLVRETEATGFSPSLWDRLVSTGVLELGGEAESGRCLSRVLVAESLGACLAPVPLLEAWAALRCLSKAVGQKADAIRKLVASGKSLVSVVPTQLSRGAGFLPFGRVADAVIWFDGRCLHYSTMANRQKSPVGRLLASAGAWIDLPTPDFTLEFPIGVSASDLFEEVVAEWKNLVAAALVGVGARALEIGTEYAKQRKAFGTTIAAFQAVSHPLADSATALEGARWLALEAAWALDRRHAASRILASMSFVAASKAAADVTRVAVHVHGGYGITREYDIQLFYRRAKSTALQLADPRAEAVRLGRSLVAEMPQVGLPPWEFKDVQACDEGFEFSLGRYARFKDDLRAFLDENWTGNIERDDRTTASSEGHSPEFHRRLASAGYLALGLPAEYGGRATDALELSIFGQELSRKTGTHNAPVGTCKLVAQTLNVVGTEEQKRRFLPKIVQGEIIVALGYTEPDGGSDAAAAKTRAVRTGDDWVINGQKMFTTSGDFADYVFLLCRTDPEKPKHRGLTMFMVPLKADGVEARPIDTIGGIRTTATFYSDVRISDDCRIGEVNGGWDVMSVALKFEHGGQSYHWQTEALLKNAVSVGQSGRIDGDSPFFERIGECAIAIEISKLLSLRLGSLRAEGSAEDDKGLGPMSKIYSSDALVRASSDLLDMLGARAIAAERDLDASAVGVEHAYLMAPGTTTYGGTVEIHRSIVAEQHLGLRRSR